MKSLIDQEQEMKTRVLVQKKEALYNETVSVVSTIANGNLGQPQLYENTIKRFWELYWGGLASVESRKIESLMVQFGNELNDYLNNTEPKNGTSLFKLKQLSLEIARSTQTEIDSLYKIPVRQ